MQFPLVQADVMSRLASRPVSPEGFKAQELANTIWALAACGSGGKPEVASCPVCSLKTIDRL